MQIRGRESHPLSALLEPGLFLFTNPGARPGHWLEADRLLPCLHSVFVYYCCSKNVQLCIRKQQSRVFLQWLSWVPFPWSPINFILKDNLRITVFIFSSEARPKRLPDKITLLFCRIDPKSSHFQTEQLHFFLHYPKYTVF